MHSLDESRPTVRGFRELCAWAYFCFVITLSSVSAGLANEGSEVLKNERDIYQDVDVCEAYHLFLAGKDVGETSDCDELTSYLIGAKDQKPPLTVLEYQENLDKNETPFYLLLDGMEHTIWGSAGPAFASLDAASNHLPGVFFSVGDLERAAAYSVLINRVKIYALRSELPPDSSILSSYYYGNLREAMGERFALLDRRRADFVLVCLLASDNLRVSLGVISESAFFRDCIMKHTTEETY